MPTTYIHTLGDSTLDNLYWMLQNNNLKTAKKLSVEGQLKEKGHRVISHAYDGFTTKSVLGSDRVGAVLPFGQIKRTYMAEKAGKDPNVSPLADLQSKIAENPNATHYVVLSVGGNDFRVYLDQPLKLIMDISSIQKRYCEIVDKVDGLQGRDIRPILAFQYRTDASHDPYHIYSIFGILGVVTVSVHLVCIFLLTSPFCVLMGGISATTGAITTGVGILGLYGSRKVAPLSVTKNILLGKGIGMSMIKGLMESFYQPMLQKAKEKNIPILDLPNTFNPYEKLYECGIEPNAAGGKLIADGIDHIVKNHDFSQGSMLYSKVDEETGFTARANQNPSAWTVAYHKK